jgi:hypothetical protein
MEGKILNGLGKIAGTAGIALGVFLLIFQSVLQKDFLPKAGLTSEQAFSVILSLMVLTFGIAGVGIIAWLIGRTVGIKSTVPGPALAMLSALIAIVLVAMIYVAKSNSQTPQSIVKQDSKPAPVIKQCYHFDPQSNKESEALGPRTCFPGRVVYIKYWDPTDYAALAKQRDPTGPHSSWPINRPNRVFQAVGLTVDGGHVQWIEQNLIGLSNELEDWGAENHYWVSVIENTGIGRGMNGFVLRRVDLQAIPLGQGKTQCDTNDNTRTIFEFSFPRDVAARISSGSKPTVGVRRLRVSCALGIGDNPLPGPEFENTDARIVYAVSD